MILKYKQFKNNFLRKIISKLSGRLDYYEQCSTLPKITYTPEINESEQEKYYLKYLNPNLKLSWNRLSLFTYIAKSFIP